MCMKRRIFTQYQTRTQSRDSSNLISPSVPTNNSYFFDPDDLSLFYCFLHKFVSKTFFLSPLHVAQHFGHSAHFTFHNL